MSEDWRKYSTTIHLYFAKRDVERMNWLVGRLDCKGKSALVSKLVNHAFDSLQKKE